MGANLSGAPAMRAVLGDFIKQGAPGQPGRSHSWAGDPPPAPYMWLGEELWEGTVTSWA